MAFLSFQNVSCRRGGATVLSDVSFDLEQGETLILLGRSGSGKTTIIQLVLGLIAPSAGEIRINGQPLSSVDILNHRRRIGYAIQETGLLPHWTVERNIGMTPLLNRWPKERTQARVKELMDQVEVPYETFAARYPFQLSGGQRQRVGIARALAADPQLLLFDEPFGALDPITRQEMQRQFKKLRDEYQIPSLFVTHDVAEALELGHRIAVLAGGTMETLVSAKDFLSATTPLASAFAATISKRFTQ